VSPVLACLLISWGPKSAGIAGEWTGRFEVRSVPQAASPAGQQAVNKVFAEIKSAKLSLSLRKQGTYLLKIPRLVVQPAIREEGKWLRVGGTLLLVPSNGKPSRTLEVRSSKVLTLPAPKQEPSLGETVFRKNP